MCGTAGLFTGCAAAVFCPVAGARPVRAIPAYRSAFGRWDERAAVRSSPRREIQAESTALFPESLVPVAGHTLVQALRPELRRRLLTRQLYRYLDFTAKLEYLVVNHVTLGIAHGSIAVPIPDEMRFDAFKIYCDEAYHALFSVDLIRQAEARTGMAHDPARQPFFLHRLAQLKARQPSRRAGLIDLLFTIVSETLISGTLTDVGHASDVDPAVADTVRDHAADEGRHHAYFAAYVNHLWASLTTEERVFASRLFPELIDIFLRPDFEDIGAELLGYGLTRDQVAEVLEDTFSESVQSAYTRTTAAKLLGYLTDLGVFEDSLARDSACAYGLLPESDPTGGRMQHTGGAR